MYNDPDKQLVREIKMMNSIIEKGFRSLYKSMEKETKSNEWIPAHGQNGCLPSKEQGWVQVKVRSLDSISPEEKPHIALHLGNDIWKDVDSTRTYGELGYAVDYWRRLPD